MELTKKLLEEAKSAKSAEELRELAKAEGMDMTADEAEKAFADLRKAGELSDEELDNVTGGCDKVNRSEDGEASTREGVVPLYHVGQKVEYCDSDYSTVTGEILAVEIIKYQSMERYYPSYKIKLKNGDIKEDVPQENIQIP